MRVYSVFNKIQNSSLTAFVICAVFNLIAEMLSYFSINVQNMASLILNDFSNILLILQPYVFCYFIVWYFAAEKKLFKAFWTVICLALFSTAYGGEMSFFVGIIAGILCVCIFDRFGKIIYLILTPSAAVIFGLLLRNISDISSNITMKLANSISGKGVLSAILFGLITAALSLFGSFGFGDLFFFKSYGGVQIINDEIITGIKDLVENGYDGELISDFLSGHYFILFALVGIAFSLFDELKGAQRLCLIVVTIASLLSGNISLLVLFLFLESPHIYVSFTFISALSYLCASLLDIRAPYLLNGGFLELLFNLYKPLYLFAGGIVFVAIGYFSAKYSTLKFGISDCLNTYIPTRLNKLVDSLGGVVNIVKLHDDFVEVRNPKLVNNFELECEIRENRIKISNESLESLREYFK